MFTGRVSLCAQTSGSATILHLLSEEEKQSGFPTLCVCVCVLYCMCADGAPYTSTLPPFTLPMVVVFWLVALEAFWSLWCYLGVSCGADGQGGRTTLSRTHTHTTPVSDSCCVDNWSR